MPLFLVASLVVHGVGFWSLARIEPAPPPSVPKPVELVMVEVESPPPPAPEPEPEPAPEPEPPPPTPAPKPKAVAPPPIKVAAAAKPVEPPPENLPPPPNDAPPPDPSAKPPPLVVGISMSSTSSAGDFAAPVGNTVYGKTDARAADPKDVKAYGAKAYVPVYQVDTAPVPLREVKAEYPREARMAGVEGSVVLAVTIEPSGEVSEVKVVKGGLGYGLEETARKALLKYRFRPATRNGEAVGTTIQFTYTWLLD